MMRYGKGLLKAGAGILLAAAVTVGVGLADDLDVQEVPLHAGWNMVSLNVDPVREFYRDPLSPGPDVKLLTDQLQRSNGRRLLILLKDQSGRFYAPEFDFCDIVYWDLRFGYQVRVEDDCSMSVRGNAVDPQTGIPMRQGWNMIAYLPQYTLDASRPDYHVLSPIIDKVVLAKDGEGYLMAPRQGVSTMPPWQPSKGYQVRIDGDQFFLFRYPYPDEQVSFPGGRELQQKEAFPEIASRRTVTDNCLSLLVTALHGRDVHSGDLVRAYSVEGRLVGEGGFDADGRCGLAVWGDDGSTDGVEGLREGEAFELRLWDAEAGRELVASPSVFHAGSGLNYEADALVALEIAAPPQIPQDFFLSPSHPNPFNSITEFDYTLAGRSYARLRIYDTVGRLQAVLVDEVVEGGRHRAAWDAGDAPGGIYLAMLEAGGEREVRKVALVR